MTENESGVSELADQLNDDSELSALAKAGRETAVSQALTASINNPVEVLAALGRETAVSYALEASFNNNNNPEELQVPNNSDRSSESSSNPTPTISNTSSSSSSAMMDEKKKRLEKETIVSQEKRESPMRTKTSETTGTAKSAILNFKKEEFKTTTSSKSKTRKPSQKKSLGAATPTEPTTTEVEDGQSRRQTATSEAMGEDSRQVTNRNENLYQGDDGLDLEADDPLAPEATTDTSALLAAAPPASEPGAFAMRIGAAPENAANRIPSRTVLGYQISSAKNYSTGLLVEANLVDENAVVNAEPLSDDDDKKGIRLRHRLYGGIIVLLGIAIILVLVLQLKVGFKGKGKPGRPLPESQSLLFSPEEFLNSLPDFTQASIQTRGSSQQQAYNIVIGEELNRTSLELLTESFVVITFYIATAGVLWANLTSASTAEILHCETPYVVCDEGSRVIHVNTSGEGLLGNMIPPEFSLLSNLQTMDVSSNQLSATLPSVKADLPQFHLFDISDNNIRGPIPDLVGTWTALTHVNFSSNEMTGVLPESVSQLTRLEVLDLSNNMFRGIIPDSWAALTSLRRLSLEKTSLRGSVPSGVCNLVEQGLILSVDCRTMDCSCRCVCRDDDPSTKCIRPFGNCVSRDATSECCEGLSCVEDLCLDTVSGINLENGGNGLFTGP